MITLVGNPTLEPIPDGIVESARQALLSAGAEAGNADWLSEGIACDLPLSGFDIDIATDAVRAVIGGLPIDVVGQPTTHRRKKLLVADMDSTIIQQECIDEIADFVGRREEVSAITESAMRGEVDFPEAVRARAQMFAGLDASVLDRAYNERITLTPGAEPLLRVMRAGGAFAALVSGGFTQFTRRVAERTGFDRHHGNELEIASGKLTGRAVEPIKGGSAKVELLNHYCRELDISRDEAIAVGDGANDIPMLEAAGLGVAFHGKPSVVTAADAAINHGDLTSLLFLQGYRQDDIEA